MLSATTRNLLQPLTCRQSSLATIWTTSYYGRLSPESRDLLQGQSAGVVSGRGAKASQEFDRQLMVSLIRYHLRHTSPLQLNEKLDAYGSSTCKPSSPPAAGYVAAAAGAASAAGAAASSTNFSGRASPPRNGSL